MWIDLSSPFFLSTVALASVVLVYGYLVTSVLPYSGFLVLALFQEPSHNDNQESSTTSTTTITEETVGYYAGWITSSFMVGRALTSYAWSKAANVHGRTRILVWSLALSVVLSLGFGLSTSFGMALLLRFGLGLSNGLIGTAKTVLTEIAGGDEIRESRSVGVCVSMYGWALLFSPIVSGLLADPLRQYPFLFPASSESSWYYALLQRFPFLLPNVVAAIVCLGSLILVQCLVPETLVRPPPQSSTRTTKTTTTTSSRSVTSLVCQWWHAVWGRRQQDTGTNHPNNKEEQALLLPIVNPPQPRAKSSSSSSLAVSATQQPHTGNQSTNNDDKSSLYGTLGTTDDHQRKPLTFTRIDSKDSYHTNKDPLRRGASASSSSETSLTNLQLPQDIVLLAAQTDIQTALRASVQAFHVEEGSLMSSIQYRQRLSAALVKRRTTLLAAAAQTQPPAPPSHTESDPNSTLESTWNNNNTTTAPSSITSKPPSPSTDTDAPNDGTTVESNTESEATIASLWAMKATRRQLIVFWLGTFFMHSVDESIPLFLMSRKGGLGLSAVAIGTVLSLSGGIFVKLQYFVYAYLVDVYGLYGSMKVGTLGMWPLIALIPLVLFLNETGSMVDLTSNVEAAVFHRNKETTINTTTTTINDTSETLSSPSMIHVEGQTIAGTHFHNNNNDGHNEYGHLTWAALIYLTLVLSVSRMCSFTFLSSLVVTMNRSVPNPSHRGAMNGFCTMGASVAKALGPPFAGLLVAFCLSAGVFSTPSAGAIVMFVALASLGGLTALGVTLLLREETAKNGSL